MTIKTKSMDDWLGPAYIAGPSLIQKYKGQINKMMKINELVCLSESAVALSM